MTKIVYENYAGNLSIVTPAPGIDPSDLIGSVVPEDCRWEIVEDYVIPEDRTFREAWRWSDETGVREDLDLCKSVAHDIRRAKRSEEFRPHDELMAARIPDTDEEAVEAARQEIRERYEKIQADIDSTREVDDLREKVKSL